MAGKTTKKTAKKAARKTSKKVTRKTAARKTGKVTRKTVAKKRIARTKEICIDLNSEQGIRDVAELHQRLLAAADHAATVIIDASSVDRVDTAILQVLTAFVIERQRQGKATRWKGPSEVFLQAARLIDLAGHLDLPRPAVEA